MLPLYAARVGDLGASDRVKVDWAACGHDTLIPASALSKGSGFSHPSLCLIWDLGSAAASATRGERRWCRSGGEGY